MSSANEIRAQSSTSTAKVHTDERRRQVFAALWALYCVTVLSWYFLGYFRSLERFQEPIVRTWPWLRSFWEAAG